MDETVDPVHLSRRGLLGAFGAATTAAGLLATGVAKASGPPQSAAPGSLIHPLAAPTPTDANLRYQTVSGYEMLPLTMPTNYSVTDSRFRFLGGSSGYVALIGSIPVGARLRQVELYGTRGVAGSVELSVWAKDTTVGAVPVKIADQFVPAVAGEFTSTLAVDHVNSLTVQAFPFAYINFDASTGTTLFGLRIGYEGPSMFVPVSPFRAYDSRMPGYSVNGPMTPNTSRVVSVKDAHSPSGSVTTTDVVPAGASAVAINATVTGTTGPNFLSVTPGDAASYATSTVNWPGGFDAANGAIVQLDALRQLKLFCGDQTGSTHVIIDVTGYYV